MTNESIFTVLVDHLEAHSLRWHSKIPCFGETSDNNTLNFGHFSPFLDIYSLNFKSKSG